MAWEADRFIARLPLFCVFGVFRRGLPLPKGLEELGKRRKEFANGEGRQAERAGASESLGRGEGEGTMGTQLRVLFPKWLLSAPGLCTPVHSNAALNWFEAGPASAPGNNRALRLVALNCG